MEKQPGHKQGSLSSFSCFLQTQVIKVFSEDETSRALEVPSDITARDVCQLLILKNHYVDDNSWTLFEHLAHTGVGKDMRLLSNSVPSGYTATRWQKFSSCKQNQITRC